MKAVAEKSELDELRRAVLKIDPRVLDHANWVRLKLVVAAELCNSAWGCKLYELERRGMISVKAKRGGDKYHQAFLDWRKWMAVDPEEFEPIRREFLYGKIEQTKRKMKEYKAIIGTLRLKHVEDIVIYEEWPWLERQKLDACEALEDLGNFIEHRTKRKRKSG